MAWVELVPIALILMLVAWIFLRPYPGSGSDKDQPLDQRSGKYQADDTRLDEGEKPVKDED